jgi:hypothetical protein
MTICLCCDRDAGHRYACHRCTNTMRRWLRDIEDYAVVLALTATPLRRGLTSGSLGASFGPRSPIREDVAVFLDVRSRTLPPRDHPGMDPADLTADGLDPHVDDPNPIRSLPGSVHGIAADLRDRLDHTQPATWSLVSELHYLVGAIESCVHSNWVGDLHDDLRELHATARTLAHDQPPAALGTCLVIDCGGIVYPTTIRHQDGTEEEGARCLNSSCRRTYHGLDLVRLGVAQEAS